MDKLVIEGGRPLSGTVRINGAKNAALPILAASIVAPGTHVIENVPDLLDIDVMLRILKALGCEADILQDKVILNTRKMRSSHVPEDLMSLMRSSIFLMGPLLSRFGSVQIYQPGGCAIGQRKIDLHLRGLEALGASIEEMGNRIRCVADRLIGAEIILDYPSVGATENIMMAAVLAEGTTTLLNAASEPEIEDLQNFLNAMGAKISGAGTDTIIIEGVDSLVPTRYRIIPDRIVAGTLMIATVATRGNVTLEQVQPAHLASLIHVLRRAGASLDIEEDRIHVSCVFKSKAVERIITSPYPAFPTDLQAQMMVLLSLSDGFSTMKETVFEGRFKHVDELTRMGADIRTDLNSAFIRGVGQLYGATVEATDLRAGAALVIAGLAASGTTVIEHIYHIDRGYERIEDIFKSLGAVIERYAQTPVSHLS